MCGSGLSSVRPSMLPIVRACWSQAEVALAEEQRRREAAEKAADAALQHAERARAQAALASRREELAAALG